MFVCDESYYCKFVLRCQSLLSSDVEGTLQPYGQKSNLMTISGFKRSQTFMALNTYFQLSKSEGCFFGMGGSEEQWIQKKNLCEHFCGQGNVAFCNILRNFVTGCFWKEMSYLVIFVRDKPLFDRLTFTIFIFKDINNECVFLLYPNLLISPNTISAWSTKYDKKQTEHREKNNI